MVNPTAFLTIPKHLRFIQEEAVKHAVERGYAPIVAIDTGRFDESEVATGLIRDANVTHLARSDELWVFGARDEGLKLQKKIKGVYVTPRVADEIERADEIEIPVKVFVVDASDNQTRLKAELMPEDRYG